MIKLRFNIKGLLSVASLFLLMGPVDAKVQRALSVEVLNEFEHDASAFTQGLFFVGSDLYESTGLNGESSLRQVDLESGEVVRSV